MQQIITDEEVERFYCIYAAHQGSFKDARKSALLDFLNNRPESTLGKLRLIEKVQPLVPEGCFRMFGMVSKQGNLFLTHIRGQDDNLFMDILQLPTPDPEAEERQRFEEAFKHHPSGRPIWMVDDKEYSLEMHNFAWTAWKLAKAK